MMNKLELIFLYVILCTGAAIVIGICLNYWLLFLQSMGESFCSKRSGIKYKKFSLIFLELLNILLAVFLAAAAILLMVCPYSATADILFPAAAFVFISYIIFTSRLYCELKRTFAGYSIVEKLGNFFNIPDKKPIPKYLYLTMLQLFSLDTLIFFIVAAAGINIARLLGIDKFEFYVAVVLLIPTALNLWSYFTFKPATGSKSWVLDKKYSSKRRGVLFSIFLLFSVIYNYYQFSNYIDGGAQLSAEIYSLNLMIMLFLVFDRLSKIWYNDYLDYQKSKNVKKFIQKYLKSGQEPH